MVSFGYDGDQQRLRKTTATRETIYFEDLYERVTTGAITEHRFYVHSPERAIAVVTRGGAEPGTRFLHVDHLGSIETVTDEQGKPVEKRSYDAFGARRNPEWGGPSIALTSKTKKGFTGHEEDDEFGLVNMKGRLMDPKIGRFTTTDPVIANVYNGQSFAAYSYVRNNPLRFVDPSGFDPETPPNPPKPPIQPIGERVTKEADGSITLEMFYPPREGQAPKALPPTNEAATCGASAPPVDTNTTGNGGEGLPQETPDVEPLRGPTLTDAIGSGLGDAVRNLWHDWTTPAWETAFRMHDAYKQGDGLDAFNQVNPLIAFANISLAIDDNDEYSVTRQSVALGATVLGSVALGMAASKITGGAGAGVGRPISAFPRKTLRGVSLKWLERNIPNGWKKVPTEANQGWIWKDANGADRLRFMRPTGKNPAASQWSRQANGYFRWQNANGDYLDIDGNVVPKGEGFQELTHIMYEGPL